MFYGGEEGVQSKIKAAQDAKKKYAETGEFTYIKTISKTDSGVTKKTTLPVLFVPMKHKPLVT